MKYTALAYLLVFLVLTTSALASIDLVAPTQNAYSNAVNMTFEYYPTASNISQCTLTIDQQQFQDFSIDSNAFNKFTVVNIAPGEHNWHITCTGQNQEQSSQRTLTIDRTPPSLQLIMPQTNTILSQITLKSVDSISNQLSCTINANAQLVAQQTVENNTQTTIPFDLANGNYSLFITCLDQANNAASAHRNVTIDTPQETLFLNISTNKPSYGLGEKVGLTINSLDGANVTIEVCPNKLGFVECLTPITTSTFPQALILPYANNTGDYIIDAVAKYNQQSAFASSDYSVINTMGVIIEADETAQFDNPLTLIAKASGAIGNVNYTWELSNGTKLHTQEITVRYLTIGNHIEKVTIIDSQGNNASTTFNANIEAVFDITVTVKDAQTGELIRNASVQFQQKKEDVTKTQISNSQGQALFYLLDETYKLFVSKEGYDYYLSERVVAAKESIVVELTQKSQANPQVTIISPENGQTMQSQLQVLFELVHSTQASCTLSYALQGDNWFTEAGTQQVNANQQATFTSNLEPGTYDMFVECVDDSAKSARSSTLQITVSTPEESISQTSSSDVYLEEDGLAIIDTAYGAYDSFTGEQRELANLLDWEAIIKEKKRIIERGERDIDTIRYRRDLSQQQKDEQERAILQDISNAKATTPIDLRILDKDTNVEYLKQSDIEQLSIALLTQKDYAFTQEQLTAYLTQVQQSFTPKTTFFKAKLFLSDGSEVPLSVISHSLTYKTGNENGLSLYVSLPSQFASSASQVTTSHEVDILKNSPPALEFPAEKMIAYYVKNDLSIENLKESKLLLLKEPTAQEINSITANATLFSLDIKTSVIASLAIIILIFLATRLHLVRHLKYLLYAESRKKPLHALKTIINDGMAQLEANNLDRAMMRYKEAKLAYEQLKEYAQNEVYEDIISFRNALDSSYFTMLAERIQNSIEKGDLSAAIDDFERLEGTFHTLDVDDQNHLINIVTVLAKKLGMGDAQ